MKKGICILLALALALSLAGCGSTEEKELDYIVSLLRDGQYDMAIHVIEGMKERSGAPSSENAGTPSGDGTVFTHELTPNTVGSDWQFVLQLHNPTDTTITAQRLEILNLWDGQPLDGEPFVFEGDQLNIVGMADFFLNPGNSQEWGDGHPVVPDFNGREYRFYFLDENGDTVILSYIFHMDPAQAPADPGPESEEARWSFLCMLENTGSDTLTLEQLEVWDAMDGTPIGDPAVFPREMLANIGLGDLVLQPGDSRPWNDGHPVVDFFNHRTYRFLFTDSRGQTVVQEFPFDLTQMPTTGGSAPNIDYSTDQELDLLTLRYDAAFEVEVAPGVYWVPASALGGSRYTNAQVYSLLAQDPQTKQAQFSTLYEALQLFQVGGFYSSDDNIRIQENGVNWEHHKPGYDAVRTNTGCCATDSNWLRYILRDDYEEIGYMATSQRDGSGHIFNYILHDGWYYFIDLTHYRTDWIATAVESGNLTDYYATDFIAGNIHKVRDVQHYVDYIQNTYGDPPGLMFLYTADNCLAVDALREQSGVTILYEEAPDVELQVVYDDPGDSLYFRRAPAPGTLPDWSLSDAYPFPE